MFPLPLTSFEEYMLCDDRPAYPMAGVFRLRFSGFLDRDAFEAAMENAVQRHPLLRATVSRNGRGRPRWIDHPDWRPNVEWPVGWPVEWPVGSPAQVNEHGFPHVTHIDVTQDPGTRVWVRERDDGHDVIIQAHHCCADALGMTQVFEDLLIGYALNQGTVADGVALMELDPRQLLQRGTPGLTAWKLSKMAHKQAVGLLGAREFAMHSPVPLARPIDDMGDIDERSPPLAFPNPLTVDLDPSETKRLIGAAKAQRVTVNDLLARDLFLAVGTWRRKRNLGNERDWLRFSIPMNLRTAVSQRMPTANCVSMVFLDRQPRSLSDPDLLLKSIHKQMGRIKRLQLQYAFVLSLGLSRLVPGVLPRMTAADKCQSTSCLSNLGPVLAHSPLPRRDGRIVSGNVVLEAVDYVIPLRPHLDAAFCVYTYANRLRMLMHYDPRAITDEHSGELLEAYVGQIRQTIDQGSQES